MSEKISCGEALIQLLQKYGVDTVFGIPGEHTLDMYRGLAESKILHVQARNEQGAGFMADGYARATGRPGVCLLITGPGVTNASTALGQAYADSIPMLLISSINATYTLGKGWGCLHEISDQRAVTAPLTALSAVATAPEDIPELIGQAYAIFNSSRPRPVHISIPTDVLAMKTAGDWQTRIPPTRPLPSPAAVKAAAALLSAAERPALYVGGGAIGASEQLTAIAEHLQAMVIATNNGKGIVADSHPLSLSSSIWRPVTQQFLATADVILAIGTELSETDSFVEKLSLPGKLIRVDIDPRKINDLYPADIGIVADAAPTATQLLTELRSFSDAASRPALLAEIEAVRQSVRDTLSADERQHVVALDVIRDALPADTIVMADITQFVYTGMFAFPLEQPGLWHYAAGFCTLGFAMPDAIGAQLAVGNRPVAVLAGDGGFMFTVQELITAVELKLPIPIIIWNNEGLNQIKDGFLLREMEPIGVSGINPDFILLAKAFGAASTRPDSAAALREAITTALAADRPTIIELKQGDAWLL